jgi:putative peptide zinc metalloprotease protein
MRFDGYYALADFLGMQNLQPRAFELTRWQLRQWLFGLPENSPEPFARNKHMFLVAYSLATWIYRFFLFLGIALLVYLMAFKLLGLLLFAVEIVWFIGRPISQEMRRWWHRRALFSFNRQTKTSLTIFILLMGLALLPWRSGISTPAILESRNQLAIHLPEAARLQQLFVAQQDYVAQGDVLLIADSPSLRHEIDQQARKTRLLELQVRRYATSADNLRNKLLSEQKLAEAQSRLSALQDRLAALTLTAPQNGRVQLSSVLTKGQWLAAEDQLLFIFTPQSHRVIAYIHENQMHRIKAGSHAKFIANDGTTGMHHATLSGFDSTAVEQLSHAQLASLYGGPIAVMAETDSPQGKPESAHYKAYADLRDEDFNLASDVQGYLHIETPRFSPISNLWRTLSALLVRESGF